MSLLSCGLILAFALVNLWKGLDDVIQANRILTNRQSRRRSDRMLSSLTLINPFLAIFSIRLCVLVAAYWLGLSSTRFDVSNSELIGWPVVRILSEMHNLLTLQYLISTFFHNVFPIWILFYHFSFSSSVFIIFLLHFFYLFLSSLSLTLSLFSLRFIILTYINVGHYLLFFLPFLSFHFLFSSVFQGGGIFNKLFL